MSKKIGTKKRSIVNGMARCSRCTEWKPIVEFSKAKKTASQIASWCKKCLCNYLSQKNRELVSPYPSKLKSKYKLTEKDFDELLKKCNNACSICKEPFSDTDKNKKRCIDHCHLTGKVRGLLCGNCNTGIGMFKDNYDLVTDAANYLKDHT